MKKIMLTQGKHTLVDDQDYEWLSRWKWFCTFDRRNYYAARKEPDGKYKQRTVFMHREVMKTPEGKITDHINGNGLDNRKVNLRITDNSVNQRNRYILKNAKGVAFVKSLNKWRATIMIRRKRIFLGEYEDEYSAKYAYQIALKVVSLYEKEIVI